MVKVTRVKSALASDASVMFAAALSREYCCSPRPELQGAYRMCKAGTVEVRTSR